MVNRGTPSELHDAVLATISALAGMDQVLPQFSSYELESMLANLGELTARCVSQATAVVAESELRGLVAESQAASTRSWIVATAPELEDRATPIAKCARVLRRRDLADVAADFLGLDLSPQTTAMIAAEYDKLAPSLKPEVQPEVLSLFRTIGRDHGPRGVTQLHAEILARYGEDGVFEDEQERCRRQVELSAGRQCNGVWHYDLTLDAEAHAVLEAAIGPLSAPQPGPDGEPDTRPVGRRRGQALVEALRRSVATAGSPAHQAKTTLLVTMNVDDLVDSIGGGTVLGTLANGETLAPSTVRRLACEADVVPAVLGGRGELLDLGATVRLFTIAQRRALWFRDRHCTFPDCSAPATWTDAHHLQHWADGGQSDLANGALLCPGHHTVVHRDDLHGEIIDGQVVWDLRPGSYPWRRQRRLA